MRRRKKPAENTRLIDDGERDVGHSGSHGGGRRMTDLWCLVLFGVGFVAMHAIAIVAFIHGDLSSLTYSADSNGMLCGVDFPAKKYMMTYVTPFGASRYVCVDQCPKRTTVGTISDPYSFACMTDFAPKDEAALSDMVGSGACSPGVFTSTSGLVKYQCIPQSHNDSFTWSTQEFHSGTVIERIEKRWKSHTAFLYGADALRLCFLLGLLIVIAFVLSLGWVMVVRYAATPIVWATVLVVPVLFGGISIALFVSATRPRHSLADSGGTSPASPGLLALCGCVSLAFCLGTLAMVYFLRKRIGVAIEIIREATIVLFRTPKVVVVPGVFGLEMLVVAMYYVAIFLFLSTATTVSDDGKTRRPDDFIRGLRGPLTFLALWNVNRVMATSRTVIAGVIAANFWGNAKPELQEMKSIASTAKITYRYYMGSLAFGSLVLAVVQTLNFLLTHLRRQLEKSGGRVAVFLLSCLQCMFTVFQRFISFLTNMAYIVVISDGTNFVTSARKSTSIIASNAAQVATVDQVADLVVACSKLLITGLSVGVAMIMFNLSASFGIEYIVWAAVTGYMVAACVMSVYSVTIDVILLGICEDPNGPHVTQELRDALDA